MKRWLIILTGTAALAVALVFWITSNAGARSAAPYAFTNVVQTDLRSTVSSTGSLSAVESVDVGTQVSGQVKEVLVDFNDYVEAGQLLAIIDTEALDASVEDAQARVVQAEAQRTQAEAQVAESQANLADARAKLERNQPLVEQGYLSMSEFQPLQTGVQTAQASVERSRAALRSSEAQVAQARAQLSQTLKDRRNAEIRAPIDGIVVERTVDAGQTVAASFETPTLFVIAKNLTHMQILADVDESDIGQIRNGLNVSFSVPAFPENSYQGIVREVRLQSTVAQNVVTYTVVVDAENPDTTLLPGMTATVDFITGEAKDVLAVSPSALQVRGAPAVRGETSASIGKGSEVTDGTTPQNRRPVAVLWYLDDAGEMQSVNVRTGLRSNALTEIEPVDDEGRALIRPGTQVIEQIIAADGPAGGQRSGGFGRRM